MMRRIHHVGVVVQRLADAYEFYRDVLGLPLLKERTIPEQGVRAALLAAGDTEIELLEPLDALPAALLPNHRIRIRDARARRVAAFMR